MKRKSTTVKQLARWIANEVAPDETGDSSLTINRAWTLDTSAGLRQKTADELITLHDRLCRAIPDDFDFSMEFANGQVFETLAFCDGPLAGFGGGFPVPLDRNLLNSLRDFDWEAFRAQAINGSQLPDNIADLADEYPATWIPTIEFHNAYSQQITNYLVFLREENQPSGVLAGDVENRTLMNCTVENLEQRNGWISLQMGQGNLIIAVVENYRLLSPDETDVLRRSELEKLPRIARAKAEGRFQAAHDAMIEMN